MRWRQFRQREEMRVLAFLVWLRLGVWMTGAVIAALIVVGLALKQRMEATSLATSIAQGGTRPASPRD